MAVMKRKEKKGEGAGAPVSAEVKEQEAEQGKRFLKIVGGLAAGMVLLFIILELVK